MPNGVGYSYRHSNCFYPAMLEHIFLPSQLLPAASCPFHALCPLLNKTATANWNAKIIEGTLN